MKTRFLIYTLTLTVVLMPWTAASCQVTVIAEQKVSDTEGEFTGVLDDGDVFGDSVAGLGDLNGDGVADLAVGARFDDDGGFRLNRGAVWILFLKDDGTVDFHQKISDTAGEFAGTLANNDNFGSSIACIGDLDGDGVVDIAVGASRDDDGGDSVVSDRGAVWILFLNADGTVKDQQKISDTEGGFDGELDDGDFFGNAVASLGDVDGDGITDLAVAARGDDDGSDTSLPRGAVWILFLEEDGTVDSYQKISDTEGEFEGELDDVDFFANAVAPLGDLNDDGVPDLVVGARLDDDGGTNRGAVWILFLKDDGTVDSYQKISDTEGEFGHARGNFGASVACPGDVDGDGIVDLVVGATGGGGAAWVLFLDDDGSVQTHREISTTAGGFAGERDSGDLFGFSIAALGDLDDNGVSDLAVGARADGDGGENRGAVWVLLVDFERFLRGDVNGNGTVSALGDGIFLLNWGFQEGPEPPCEVSADCDDDGEVSGLRDALYLFRWGFTDGPALADPGPYECGRNPTANDLSCEVLAGKCQ